MKRTWNICLICLLMVLATLIPLAVASADTITTNGGYIRAYASDKETMVGYVDVPQQSSTAVDGWYPIKHSFLGTVYVSVNDVTIVVTPTATPKPGDPTPTPKPGTTATPAPIGGVTDSEYQGTVLSYTVKAGGLWLYNGINGTAVESVAQGTTFSMTREKDADGNNLDWYSLYYKGKVYYVPQSILSVDTNSGTASEQSAAKASIRSVNLSADTVLYTSYKNTNRTTPIFDGATNNTLSAGSWVNAKYVDDYAYSCTLNSKTYYFTSGAVGSTSSASVASSTDTTLMSIIKVKAGALLYINKSTSSNHYVLSDAQSLYGVKLDSDWYHVMYGPENFYLHKDDVDGAPQQVADNEKLNTSTFYATVGSTGAYAFSSTSVKMISGLPDPSAAVKSFSPGASVLVSPYNTSWYTYVETNASTGKETTYYIYRNYFADMNQSTTVSGVKVYLPVNTSLYNQMNTSNKTNITIGGDYYTVQTISTLWYSISYNSQTYYIYRSGDLDASTKKYYITLNDQILLYKNDGGGETITLNGEYAVTQATTNSYGNDPQNYYSIMVSGTEYLIDKSNVGSAKDNTAVPISNTTTGKTYTVTIGLEGAVMYSDSACTVQIATLQPGEVVKAQKYTSSLYIVDNAGAKMYLPVRYIASVKGGDDSSSGGAEDVNTDISGITKGQTDSTFKQTVLSYTIPQGGLWLYYEKNVAAGGRILNQGNTVKLTGIVINSATGEEDSHWYTTWYGGEQYYVNKSALTVKESDMASSGSTYSVKLLSTVTLYKESSLRTSAGLTLAAGQTVNVKVATRNTVNSVTTVTAYSYAHASGTTYYFAARTNGADNVDTGSILSATLSSNTDASLITKLTLKTDADIYVKADTSSTRIKISASEANPVTLYGIKYSTNWYQVVYNNTSWYLQSNLIAATDIEQISVSSGAASTTYTVVITSGGAPLYTKPDSSTTYNSADKKNYPKYGYPSSTNQISLPGGTTVAASQYSGSWYTLAYDDGAGGVILYFQNTGAANSNSNASVSSYQIILKHDADGNEVVINLYNMVSENAPVIQTAKLRSSVNGTPYTLRKIDSTWSSVIVDGRTYYLKNSSIPSQALKESTPIASTSVGSTYKITLGGKALTGSSVTVYSSSTLKGNVLGSLAAGTQTTGTKMYVESAATSNGSGLVYQITYNGVKGYIDASYVSGVASGDEATEAQQAGQGSTTGGLAIGETALRTINAGTKLYFTKSSSAMTTTLAATTSLSITKLDATWYSVAYESGTFYMLATAIETGGNSGGSIAVGESFTLTFTAAADVYLTMDSSGKEDEIIFVGETHTLRKVNDSWYQVSYNGKTMYIPVSQVKLPAGTGTTNPTPSFGTTTDGVGIITAQLMISPSTGTVNLRKSASTSGSSTILARIPKGTLVTNNGYTKDSNNQLWYSVSYNGTTGYVIGTYVTAVGTASTGSTLDPTQDIGKVLTVNVSSVNIRGEASTKATIIGKLEKGATLVPIDTRTGDDGMTWYKFQYNTTTVGYIRADFLSGGSIASNLAGNVAIKSGETNLRSGAGESFGLITKLARDVIVTIVGSGTDSNNVLWYRVTMDNLSGYVRSDLLRPLTTAEASSLISSVASQYTQLSYGDKSDAVKALQQQLINIGYLAAGNADGSYGNLTTNAVKAFQSAKGLSATGVATPATQAAIFNTSVISTGSTQALDWFSTGYALINKNPNIQIYDINAGITWNAKYINGANHADVIPASKADATKLQANNITGSYVRRPVIVSIAGSKFAGSMYAVGHGSTSYCSYFNGVMCIHFTGSKTHGTGNVDADHQAAITDALKYGN